MDNYEFEGSYKVVSPGDPAALELASQTFSAVGLSLFEILLISTMLQGLAAALINLIDPSLMQNNTVVLLLVFAPIYFVAFPAGIKMLQRIDAYPVQERKFGADAFIAAFCVCVFMMYAGNLAGVFITSIFNEGVALDPLSFIANNDSVVLRTLIAVLFGPFVEEYVFRKLLIDRINIYGERLAVVTSALMFGLFHGNLSQFFYAFLIGLVFAYSYIRSGKLAVPFGLHMAVNFIGGVASPYFYQFADLETLQTIQNTTDPDAMMQLLTPGIVAYMIYATFLMVVVIAGFIIFLKRRKKLVFEPAALEIPQEDRRKTVWRNKGMMAFLLGCIALMIYSTVAGALLQ